MGYEQSPMSKILETIADRLVDMHLSNNRRFDELAAQLEALLPAKVGEQLSLLAIVTASEPTVVPNEDEAMPVLASCPTCDTKAYTEAGIEDFFGWRKMDDGKTIRQSWCRECRKLEQATSPRKKQRLPDDVRDQGVLGRRFLKKAAAKRDERAKVLEASSGRETKESLALLREEQDLTTQGMAELSGYDTKRAILRKTNGNK
jgi:hypothetical protein